MDTERVVYDVGHIRRVAYLNSDNDCVVIKTYAIQGGEISRLLNEDVITERDAKIALSLLKGK